MSADARWGDGTPKDIVLFLCQRNILLWVCVGRYLKHLQALSHRNSNSVAMIEQLKKPKSRTLLTSFRLVTRSQTALSHRPTSTQTGRARSPTGPVMRWMLTHTNAPCRSDISLPCDSLWWNKSQDYREKVRSWFSAVSENTLSHHHLESEGFED